MREIKFRAFNTELKKMVYPTDRGWFDKVIRSKKSGVLQTITINLLMTNDYPEVELMQYTGLKDKNGAEIYEGDILEYPDLDKGVYLFKEQPKRRSVMKWHEQDAAFRIPGTGFRINTERVEVIGNVWESGGLLDDSKQAETD